MYDNDHPSFLSPEQSESEMEEFRATDPPQDQVKFLYSSMNPISSEQSEMKNKLASIESIMARIDEKLFGGDTKGKGRAESSFSTQLMTISRSTDLTFDSMSHSRSDMFHLANSERMLKKIELPMFDAQVSGLDDQNSTDIFYNGLKQEMKEVETKGNRVTSSLHLRTSSQYNSQRSLQNSDKTTFDSGGTTQAKGGISGASGVTLHDIRPRQQHTKEELDEMRRNKICFKCKGKYFKDHPCPFKELRVLTVVNGIDMVVLDEWDIHSEQEDT
ncbi:unnamed protein product [Cochlearia groenlandica]